MLQLAFERKGYKKSTSIFRKIDNDEFSRNTQIRESIYVNSSVDEFNETNFPIRLDGFTLKDEETMMLFKMHWMIVLLLRHHFADISQDT